MPQYYPKAQRTPHKAAGLSGARFSMGGVLTQAEINASWLDKWSEFSKTPANDNIRRPKLPNVKFEAAWKRAALQAALRGLRIAMPYPIKVATTILDAGIAISKPAVATAHWDFSRLFEWIPNPLMGPCTVREPVNYIDIGSMYCGPLTLDTAGFYNYPNDKVATYHGYGVFGERSIVEFNTYEVRGPEDISHRVYYRFEYYPDDSQNELGLPDGWIWTEPEAVGMQWVPASPAVYTPLFQPFNIPARVPVRSRPPVLLPQLLQQLMTEPALRPPNRPKVPVHTKPGPKVKEQKVKVAVPAGFINDAINFVTESMDFLQVLWKALPAKWKTKKRWDPVAKRWIYPTPQQKIQDVYEYFGHADIGYVAQVLQGLLENHVEDNFYGQLGQLTAEANQLTAYGGGYQLGPALEGFQR